MSRELRILPEAEAELLVSAEWYESRQPGLGVAFVDAVGRATAVSHNGIHKVRMADCPLESLLRPH